MMQNNDEPPDEVDVILREYAASRRTFAGNAPDLHEADIRRLAEAAGKEWRNPGKAGVSLWERVCGFVESLSTPQLSAAGMVAVTLLFFAVWLPLRESDGDRPPLTTAEGPGTETEPGPGSQRFAMVASGFRGESAVFPPDFRHFDLDLNPDSNEVALIFRDGTRLTGKTLPDEGVRPVEGEPMSYSVSASGLDSQNLPVLFKGTLTAVQDPAFPERRAAEVSLRGILTANSGEIRISAGTNQP